VFDLPLQLAPGKLIVFEGLDDTGKSTQIERFEAACYRPTEAEYPLYDPIPMFTHQPSGATGVGPDIYSLTEGIDWSKGSPLTRQLLHLSAHSEHYHHDIIPALKTRSVIMDRCWWSTFAYGYRGEIAEAMSPGEWLKIIQLPARGIKPDLVFLFTHRYGEKASSRRTSSDRITFENYMELADRYADRVCIVPDHNAGEVTAYISGQLYSRGLVATAPKEQ
jgi:thymidylate kinase